MSTCTRVTPWRSVRERHALVAEAFPHHAAVNGILGARVPHVGRDGWRWFYTQQHGDNVTWELTFRGHDRDDD